MGGKTNGYQHTNRGHLSMGLFWGDGGGGQGLSFCFVFVVLGLILASLFPLSSRPLTGFVLFHG